MRGYIVLKETKRNVREWVSLSPEPGPKIQKIRINMIK